MTKPFIKADHFIDPVMFQKIREELARIEEENNITILYACESGSRGWGFPSPDSDYDVRFIYVNELDWYLGVDTVVAPEKRDVIECPINKDLDISGWDLRKTLALLRNSNPTINEWLNTPVVYYAEDAFLTEMKLLVEEIYNKDMVMRHYFGMAKKNMYTHLQGEEVRLKKYLYVIRPLLACRWLRSNESALVPMEFDKLANSVLTEEDLEVINEINRLLEVKKDVNESQTTPHWPILDNFILSELEKSKPEDWKVHQSRLDESIESLSMTRREIREKYRVRLDRFLRGTILRNNFRLSKTK